MVAAQQETDEFLASLGHWDELGDTAAIGNGGSAAAEAARRRPPGRPVRPLIVSPPVWPTVALDGRAGEGSAGEPIHATAVAVRGPCYRDLRSGPRGYGSSEH